MRQTISLNIRQGITRRRGDFASKLLEWSVNNLDDYPWRRSRDPYEILISEMLLRRTRATKVAEVYREFIHKFPDPIALANGRIGEIEQIIEPLGIVSRAAKMKKVARSLVENYSKKFPSQESTILSTIGIQSLYAANAIRCFAFDESVPIFDANVKRILERVFSLQLGIDAHKQKSSWDIARLLVPKSKCREYNFALLDVGRRICTPSRPNCRICPLNSLCDFVKRSDSEPTRVLRS